VTSPPPAPPSFQPRRLARWALTLPIGILAYTLWQLLLARVLFGGAFQGGLTWVEGTAEAASILVAAFIAPGRKRAVALAGLGFYSLRNLAVLVFAPGAATPGGAATTIGLAIAGTAIVFALTRRSHASPLTHP
jgi:hypothetical protein